MSGKLVNTNARKKEDEEGQKFTMVYGGVTITVEEDNIVGFSYIEKANEKNSKFKILVNGMVRFSNTSPRQGKEEHCRVVDTGMYAKWLQIRFCKAEYVQRRVCALSIYKFLAPTPIYMLSFALVVFT